MGTSLFICARHPTTMRRSRRTTSRPAWASRPTRIPTSRRKNRPHGRHTLCCILAAYSGADVVALLPAPLRRRQVVRQIGAWTVSDVRVPRLHLCGGTSASSGHTQVVNGAHPVRCTRDSQIDTDTDTRHHEAEKSVSDGRCLIFV